MSFQQFINERDVGLRETLIRVLTLYSDLPCLGYRGHSTFRWLTYDDVRKRAFEIANAILRQTNVKTIGLCGRNDPTWIINDFAACIMGATTVGIHPHWQQRTLERVLMETNVNVLMIERESCEHVLSRLSKQCRERLHLVVVTDNFSSHGSTNITPKIPYDVIFMSELLLSSTGAPTNHASLTNILPEYTYLYTSGSSGRPKGLAISRKQWLSNARISLPCRTCEDPCVMSHMSLAHGGDRGLVWQSVFNGIRVGFSNMDLFVDARELKPSFILCMSEFYVTLHANYNRKIVRWFEQTYPRLSNLPLTKDLPISVLKKLAHHFAEQIDISTGTSVALDFRQEIRDSMGGRLFNIVTGGGKIETNTLEFLEKTFFGTTSLGKSQGSRVVNSYGSTECPGISQNGIVNTASYEFKLCSDEGESDVEIGEIWVRPKFNFDVKREYLNSPMESKKVFLDSGWYVTGDIGQLIFKNGEERLIILGRKNTQQEELYVNHASVWVDVKALESSFLDIPIFQHVFLSGDRNRSYLVAVVVGVDIQLSSKFVDENELISQFERYAPQDAKPYEIPRAVVVVSKESWKRAVASTHSSKIQRLALKQHFSDEIAEAFARIESKESSVSTKHHNKIEDDETIKHIVETILKESLYDQNRKEQPQLHIPKDFVDFRFVLEDKKEEKALNHILNEAVVCVKIFRSSKSKWRRELLHMNRVKETRELEFQSKMNIFTKEIMKLSQALMKEVMEMLCSEVKKSTTTTWFKTFSKLRKLIKSRKMLAMQHQVRQSSFASSNHLKSDERSRIERDLNRATSRLSRLARLFKTNVPWQISSGAWLISSSSDAEPLLEQSMGEKRVYDYISSRCLETKFVSDRSKRIMRYRCLEAPEVCVDIHSMRFIRTLRAVSAILKSFDLYSKATLELNEFVTKLIPYGNLNYSFWIKEDLHPFHLRTEIMNVPTKFCTLSKKETSLMTQKMISVECIVENEKSRKIHVNDLVPNLSTISDLLSMVNEVEIDPDRHIYDTFTAKTMDMSAQISDSTKIILRKCENFKDEYTLVRIHHKGGTNEIVLRNAKYISAREVRRRIASVLNWKVESLDQVRLSTSLDLSKGIIDNQGLLGNYLEDNIKTGTITFWAKNMATITTASPTEKDTPARYLTRACAMFSARPALGTNRENEKNEIEALLSTSSHLERRSSFFYITYKDLHALAACVSVGLRRLLPFNNKRVGISGPNSIAWSIVDFACMLASRTSVGIHQTYDTKSVEHVLQNSNIGVLFLTSDQLFQSIKSKRWNGKSVLENSSTVNHLVLLDSDVITEDEEKKWISKHRGVSLWSLKDLMDDKEEQEQKQEQEQENSELTVLYTSGSSGRPKGVIVSSDTFLSDISEAIYTIPLVTCSYIPLSHSSDRMKLWKFLANGGRVGFVSYDPENWSEHEIAKKSELVGNFVSNQFNGVMQLFNQIRELSPSAMSCPPRIWNGLFNIYLKEKEKRGEKEALKCVASMFGTRIKTIATGGGVTSLIVMDFAQRLANCCGAHFMESYGTTEVGAIAENSKPRPNVYVRLGKHHFGSSKACHNIGELEVKTETMSSGYLNNHKATKEAFLKDGYFRTGDLVRLHPKSKKIKILGRSSAAVVTKSGHVVFLARLESTYETRSKLIDRVLVVAQSDFDDVVAVVVPSISSKGEDDIRNDMMKIARELKLSDIEIPKRVHVSKMKWSVSNGLLAGNTKIMRKKLCSYYSNEIKRMWMSLKVLQK